jgi:hypothetical protein
MEPDHYQSCEAIGRYQRAFFPDAGVSELLQPAEYQEATLAFKTGIWFLNESQSSGKLTWAIGV